MPQYTMAEVFGFAVHDRSESATLIRSGKHCPFKSAPCTKVSAADPMGICTLRCGSLVTTICPVRFQEGDTVLVDAARLAFGVGVSFKAIPEFQVLRSKNGRRIGKVDFMLLKLDEDGNACDFAALEVQSTYVSGRSMRSAFEEFIGQGTIPPSFKPRPDFRSSAQKRLMPQLALKLPVFRRWGKKFFVVVDSVFYGSLPQIRRRTDFANSEITWLVYDIALRGNHYRLGPAESVFTLWDDVADALREGKAPTPSEVMAELESRARHQPLLKT